MNLNNAKEVKRNVDAVIAKRKPVKTETTKKPKTTKTKKPLTKKQKEKKKKFRKFLLKLLAIEYITAGAILLYAFGMNLINTNNELYTQLKKQEIVMTNLSNQIVELRSKPEVIKMLVEKLIYLGTFKITHYCDCTICCGPNAQGITASGKPVEENKTIAVDPKVIPLGSKVYIDGYGYMEAQDTGSAIKGNIIDVYVNDHQKALELGVVYKDVYLVK